MKKYIALFLVLLGSLEVRADDCGGEFQSIADASVFVGASFDGHGEHWNTDTNVAQKIHIAKKQKKQPVLTIPIVLERTLKNDATKGPVTSMRYRGDGTLMAVTSRGSQSTVIWDMQTNRPVATLTISGPPTTSVAFSPTEKKVVTTGASGALEIWDIDGPAKSLFKTRTDGPLTAATVSPDGRTFATVGETGLKIWDMKTGKVIRSIASGKNPPEAVAFSPEGKSLATGSEDGVAIHGADGELVRQIRGEPYRIRSIAFSPDGRTLATAALDDTARLWDVATGRPIRRLDLSLSADSIQFSADGRSLLASTKEKISVWDTETGNQIQQTSTTKQVRGPATFSPDGTSLAVGSYDGTVDLWKLR